MITLKDAEERALWKNVVSKCLDPSLADAIIIDYRERLKEVEPECDFRANPPDTTGWSDHIFVLGKLASRVWCSSYQCIGDLLTADRDELRRIKNFGEKSLANLDQDLVERYGHPAGAFHGYEWSPNDEPAPTDSEPPRP